MTLMTFNDRYEPCTNTMQTTTATPHGLEQTRPCSISHFAHKKCKLSVNYQTETAVTSQKRHKNSGKFCLFSPFLKKRNHIFQISQHTKNSPHPF